ncbi:MAG: selenide, water dikinase SelD [Candidatus Thorarchaeota archaeon]|nr:selenide, water dikinase SelD [Candidatus Thorarchaeota archaeon]
MIRIINDDVAIVENVDIFTPIHDDPQIQGEIVACNATNDVFAMGATKLLSLQAFLAYPKDLPEEIVVGVLTGMKNFMERHDAKLAGGQTIKNPVPVFGGIALGTAHPRDIVYSHGAKAGDVVLLTKPLGIQPAMRSYRDLKDEKRDVLLSKFDEADLKNMQDNAVRLMTFSNLEVAQAMQEVGVHAATDVTGFGLLGHAGNVSFLSGVDVVIDQIPVIRGTLRLAEFFGHKLSSGFGSETAGGMLVFLDSSKADEFRNFLAKKNLPCWTIGKVVEAKGSPCARLAQEVQFIETDFP